MREFLYALNMTFSRPVVIPVELGLHIATEVWRKGNGRICWRVFLFFIVNSVDLKSSLSLFYDHLYVYVYGYVRRRCFSRNR